MISVIIPTYNRGHLIERAIRSVADQTFSDIEIIVVDDASTDDTAQVVEKLEIPQLRYIKLDKNQGACHARNVGIEKSSGDFISFLDSDDAWEKEKLSQQFSFLNSHEANVVFCNFWQERGGIKTIKIKHHDEIYSLQELLNVNVVTTGSLLVKKDAIIKVGCFDETMPRYQDWELVLRLAKNNTIYFQNMPLLTLFFQDNSISNSTSKEKKFLALEKMVAKNIQELQKYPKAYAHHCWSMGLYSMYMKEIRWDLIKKGYKLDGFNIRRFVVYCFLRCGFVELFKKQYGKTH